MSGPETQPEPDGAPRLSLTRDFAASVERLWTAWTRPEAMLRWLGPVEWPASEVRADIREGGAWRACLMARDGSDAGPAS